MKLALEANQMSPAQLSGRLAGFLALAILYDIHARTVAMHILPCYLVRIILRILLVSIAIR